MGALLHKTQHAPYVVMVSSAERQLVYTKRKRAAGKCGYSGCHAHSGDLYHCPEHSKTQAERDRARRRERKAAEAR